jgi:tetratricopeptide (TPR) repeat protein
VVDRTITDQGVSEARQTQTTGLAARAAALGQAVVGAVPRQPPGFRAPADLLAALDRASAGVHVITGPHGVGKTQLAAAYAREKLAQGWRLVVWVDARNIGSLLAGLAAVADVAGLSAAGSPNAIHAVRHLLETDGERCLLVFDDVEAPDVVRPFVSVGGAARVLITTARQSVADLGPSVSVDVFGAEDAREFLNERTGLHDEAGADGVAAELGHVPLALAQAAAVMTGHQLGYEKYLWWLRALPVEKCLIPEQGRVQQYPPGVAEAVLLSLEADRASDPTGACAGVMEMMAVLSAAGVRRELLRAAVQSGASVTGRDRVAADVVERALERLADGSLLAFSLDGRTIIAHRLVTRVVRERLARQGSLAAVCRAAASVLEARADALLGSPDRPAVRDIAAQVTALLDTIAGTAAHADEQLFKGLLRLRFLALYHLVELGDSTLSAIAAGQSLTEDLERLLGPDHPDTLNARNSLAAAYHAAGLVAKAIPLFEQTLAGRAEVLGPDHPDTLNSQNNLAVTYSVAGRIDAAIPFFELTLAARERLLGADHPSTVNSRRNLINAYRDAGRDADAIPLLEQALAACQRLLGADDPRTVATRENLALAYRETGRP